MKLCKCSPMRPDPDCSYGLDLFNSLEVYNLNSKDPGLSPIQRNGMTQMYYQTTNSYLKHVAGIGGNTHEAQRSN